MTLNLPFDDTWADATSNAWDSVWAYSQQFSFLNAASGITHPAAANLLKVVIGPNDQPGQGGANGTYSALWMEVRAGHRPTDGDSFYRSLAFAFPSTGNTGGPNNTGTNVRSGFLFDELHNGAPFYSAPTNGDIGTIAPLAWICHAPDARWTGTAFTSSGVDTSTVGLCLRIAAGNCDPGGAGTDRPQILIPGLQPTPMDKWINIVEAVTVRGSPSSGATGRYRVWLSVKNKLNLTAADFTGTEFDVNAPLLDITGVYTNDWRSSSGGVDQMYHQAGSYGGDPNPQPVTTVIQPGSFFRATFNDAVIALTGAGSTGGGPPPPPPPPAHTATVTSNVVGPIITPAVAHAATVTSNVVGPVKLINEEVVPPSGPPRVAVPRSKTPHPARHRQVTPPHPKESHHG